MSISDELMWRYFELLSFRPVAEIDEMKARVGRGENPRDIKFVLAGELVARFHSDAEALAAREAFIARFQKGAMPEDIPDIQLDCGGVSMPIPQLLKGAGLTSSTSEAIRMLAQGAVRVDGERVTDRDLAFAAGSSHVFQVGKRKFARVSLAA
jgi:tyrosyl-tRNA synthetase